VSRPKKGGGRSGRSAGPPQRPLRFLEFLDRVLASAAKTRRMIGLFTALTIAAAILIAAIGVMLYLVHAHWIATALISSATAAVSGAIGLRISGRRKNSSDEPDDTDD